MKPNEIEEIKAEPEGNLAPAPHHDFFMYAYRILYVIGVIGCISAIIKLLSPTDYIAGYINFGLAVVLLVLGSMVQRRKSIAALIAAIIIYSIDSILVLLGMVLGWNAPTISVGGGILLRIVFLGIMLKGIGAMKAMKKIP